MKTASFFTFRGEGRVSIARHAPRGSPAGYRVFAGLAPGPWFNSVGAEEYHHRFAQEILGRLDPKETWERLHAMAGDAEPILLCWERPPFTETNWCHRRLVAAFFEEKLGVMVPELEVRPTPPTHPATMARKLGGRSFRVT